MIVSTRTFPAAPFFNTCSAIELIDGHILRARCFNAMGEAVDSQVDLNQFIGNFGGHLEWGGSGYIDTALNITLQDGWKLGADLPDASGNYLRSEQDLLERLGVENGVVTVVPTPAPAPL